MQKAKAFLFVSAGIFLLALSYHLGASNATAQAGAQVMGFSMDGEGLKHFVMTPNGDIFYRGLVGGAGPYGAPATYIGNFWDAPTPTQQSTFGSVKVRWR